MNMKFLLATPLLAACALTSPLAMAASADLQLNGEIVAGACHVSASNNGVADYGEIPNDSLVSGSRKKLSRITLDMDVTCAAPIQVGFKLIDNRAGTLPADMTGNNHYGLNRDLAGNPIGYFVMGGADTTFNGSPGRIINTSNQGGSWNIMNGSA